MNVRKYSSVFVCVCVRVCVRESIVVYASEYSSVFREFE